MFGGGYGGFGGYRGAYGNNNPFAGGFGELASDWAINQFVPGGLNSKFKQTKIVNI
jgi:hypothetical protein